MACVYVVSVCVCAYVRVCMWCLCALVCICMCVCGGVGRGRKDPRHTYPYPYPTSQAPQTPTHPPTHPPTHLLADRVVDGRRGPAASREDERRAASHTAHRALLPLRLQQDPALCACTCVRACVCVRACECVRVLSGREKRNRAPSPPLLPLDTHINTHSSSHQPLEARAKGSPPRPCTCPPPSAPHTPPSSTRQLHQHTQLLPPLTAAKAKGSPPRPCTCRPPSAPCCRPWGPAPWGRSEWP
jgi:hypothetical protein